MVDWDKESFVPSTERGKEAYEHLEWLADLFGETGNEVYEDQMHEIMERLVGWCSPHAILHIPEREDTNG